VVRRQTSSTHQVRQKTAANSTWSNVKTELDGHGRPLRTIELAQGTAPNDAITSFVYANDGTLQSVSLPDPTRNNASTVSYRYGFDSLGRAISIRRPDSTTLTSQAASTSATTVSPRRSPRPPAPGVAWRRARPR